MKKLKTILISVFVFLISTISVFASTSPYTLNTVDGDENSYQKVTITFNKDIKEPTYLYFKIVDDNHSSNSSFVDKLDVQDKCKVVKTENYPTQHMALVEVSDIQNGCSLSVYLNMVVFENKTPKLTVETMLSDKPIGNVDDFKKDNKIKVDYKKGYFSTQKVNKDTQKEVVIEKKEKTKDVNVETYNKQSAIINSLPFIIIICATLLFVPSVLKSINSLKR